MVTAEKIDLKENILYNLKHGHPGAIRKDDLTARLGYRDSRPVRDTIHTLRLEGQLIISARTKPFGYYLADSFEEYIEGRDYLKNYLIELAKVLAAWKKTAEVKDWVKDKFLVKSGQMPLGI